MQQHFTQAFLSTLGLAPNWVCINDVFGAINWNKHALITQSSAHAQACELTHAADHDSSMRFSMTQSCGLSRLTASSESV